MQTIIHLSFSLNHEGEQVSGFFQLTKKTDLNRFYKIS